MWSALRLLAYFFRVYVVDVAFRRNLLFLTFWHLSRTGPLASSACPTSPYRPPLKLGRAPSPCGVLLGHLLLTWVCTWPMLLTGEVYCLWLVSGWARSSERKGQIPHPGPPLRSV